MKKINLMARFVGISSLLLTLMCAETLSAQVTRGEVEGIATGRVRSTKASSAGAVSDFERGESDKEWINVADQQRENMRRFQFGARGGVSGLVIKNAATVNIHGLGGNAYQILNRCKYIDETTPRSERQNRVSWNVSAFGRFNFGKGGNLQLELNYDENRYETKLANQSDPDKFITTGTIYDRSLHIPVLIGWKYSVFRMYMGPQFRVWNQYKNSNTGDALKHNIDSSDILYNFKNVEIDHSLVEFVAGFAIEVSYFVLDFRYYTPFKQPVQKFYTSAASDASTDFKLGMHSFQVSMGFMF